MDSASRWWRTPSNSTRRPAALDARQIEKDGLVLERNLEDVTTFSVGQLEGGQPARELLRHAGPHPQSRRQAGLWRRYTPARGAWLCWKTCSRIRSRRICARPCRPHWPITRQQVECFPGTLVSRCNYDVAMGTDNGRQRLGVLEQSLARGRRHQEPNWPRWRRSRPIPQSCGPRPARVKIYGTDVPVPPGADVYYQGEDRNVGPLTKYAILESSSDGHTCGNR